MPIKTTHYGLEAFTWGDIYSSSVDQRRFIAIDNQLAFISDMIGGGTILDAVIWTISEKPPNPPTSFSLPLI